MGIVHCLPTRGCGDVRGIWEEPGWRRQRRWFFVKVLTSATGGQRKLWMLKVYIASGRVDKLMEKKSTDCCWAGRNRIRSSVSWKWLEGGSKGERCTYINRERQEYYIYLAYFYSLPLDIHLWPPLERGCCTSWAFDLPQHSSLCWWWWGSTFWTILA